MNGGSGDGGTVYSISTTGEKRTTYRFRGGSSDGGGPYAGLVDVKGVLYGTTYGGGLGPGRAESVLGLSTAGVESVIYNFQGGSDGALPRAGLVDLSGTLYGTTTEGGGSGCYHGCGVVYSVTTSGQESVLYRFRGGNSDGETPYASLVDVNGVLYGTTIGGGKGKYGCGTVFKVTISGSERVLHSFNCYSDGEFIQGPLIATKGTLYGATEFGGSSGGGTFFSMSTNGTEKVLHNFAGGADGEVPISGPIYRNGTFYGTTLGGGSSTCSSSYSGCGVVYGVTASGSENVLHAFQWASDGQAPARGTCQCERDALRHNH